MPSSLAVTFPVTFTWTIPPTFFEELYSFQGSVPVVTFNGKDEKADTPAASYWSPGDGSSDSPFSVGAWVNLADPASRLVMLVLGDGGQC